MSKPSYRVTWEDVARSQAEQEKEYDVRIVLAMESSTAYPPAVKWVVKLYDPDAPPHSKQLHWVQFTAQHKHEASWPAHLMRHLWEACQEYEGQPWLWSERRRRRSRGEELYPPL